MGVEGEVEDGINDVPENRADVATLRATARARGEMGARRGDKSGLAVRDKTE